MILILVSFILSLTLMLITYRRSQKVDSRILLVDRLVEENIKIGKECVDMLKEQNEIDANESKTIRDAVLDAQNNIEPAVELRCFRDYLSPPVLKYLLFEDVSKWQLAAMKKYTKDINLYNTYIPSESQKLIKSEDDLMLEEIENEYCEHS